MTIERVTREPLGIQVVEAWKAQGIGVPDVLAYNHRLTLPIWRHSERHDPLAIDLGLSRGVLYRAEVTDTEVLRAISASHAYDLIGEFAYSDGLYVEHSNPEDFDPASFWCESSVFSRFAREVWLLHFFSQRFLDFAEGVEIGKPVVKFDAAAAVRAVTGLELGPKPVEAR